MLLTLRPEPSTPALMCSRSCLALAVCGAALLSSIPAHAQYDQVEGPGGPVVFVPQITVRRAEVPAGERAQLMARPIPPGREAALRQPATPDISRLQRPQGTARTSTPNYNGG